MPRVRAEMAAKRVIGWKLDRDQRRALLDQFVPVWPDVIADHVTLEGRTSAPLPGPVSAAIVGESGDDGLQALVVAIDGQTKRPDGSTFHITWSLDRGQGRRAVQSNDVIKERGWTRLAEPVPVDLTPAVI